MGYFMSRFEDRLANDLILENALTKMFRPRFYKDDTSAHVFLVNFSKNSPKDHITHGIDLLKNPRVLGHMKSIIFRELMNHPNISKEQVVDAGKHLPPHYMLRGDMIHYERALDKTS